MTQWSLGPRFAVVLLIAALLLTMGWLAPLEGDVAAGLPLGAARRRAADDGAGARPARRAARRHSSARKRRRRSGRSRVEAALATMLARRARSAVCTLIAGLAAIVAVEEFVAWVFHPHGSGTFRAMLVVLTLAFAAAVGATARSRARARRSARQRGRDRVAAARRRPRRRRSFSRRSRCRTWARSIEPRPCTSRSAGSCSCSPSDSDSSPTPGSTASAARRSSAWPSWACSCSWPASRRPAHGSLVGWPLFLLVIGARRPGDRSATASSRCRRHRNPPRHF